MAPVGKDAMLHGIDADYKTSFPNAANRIKQNGFSGASTVAGRDHAIAVLYLQKRHEDATLPYHQGEVGEWRKQNAT